MKHKDIRIPVVVYDSIDELPEEIRELMEKAKHTRKNAYAPYSKFKVGAALRLSSGEIITGNNQENAAYPSGLCAERVAVYNAGANFPKVPIQAIAITAGAENHTVSKPVAPCGACRQSIAEYEQRQNSPIEIYFMGEVGQIYKVNSLKDLLPLSFDSSYL